MDNSWADLKFPALKAKCIELGLPSTGLKKDLVDRLEQDRRAKANRNRGQFPNAFRASDTRHTTGKEDDYDRRESLPSWNPDGKASRHQSHQDRSNTNDPDRDFSTKQNNNFVPQQDISQLSEAELEALCRQNWHPPQQHVVDPSGYERRAKIRAEHDAKFNTARTKRDAAIAKAHKKYHADVEALNGEREESLRVLEGEVGPRREKKEAFWLPLERLRVCLTDEED